MPARTTLVAHAPTAATATSAFARDEPLDDRGRTWARAAAGTLTRVDRVLHAPAPACRETVALMGPGTATPAVHEDVPPPRSRPPGRQPAADPRWRDWDLGRWAGRTLDEVPAAELGSWLTDPDSAVHGGESLTALLARVAAALEGLPDDGHTVVVTHAAVVRAAVLSVLGAPATGFWRIDIAPLTATDLRGGPGRWTIRSTGRPLGR